jgi:branched-chain amino acid aminotransferase
MYYNADSIVFLDGQWIPAAKAETSLFGQTLHYGNGVFEGIRAYKTTQGTHVFKAEEHFRRMAYSAGRMHLPMPYTPEELTEISYTLLEKNGLSDAYIRPLLFGGPNMSLTPPSKTHLFMCAWTWGKLLGEKPVRLGISSIRRPHPESCFVDAKVTGHYTNSIIAGTDARSRGYDDALLLDTGGYVAEGPGANFFMEKDQVLYTPPTGHILPGITRSTILKLCREVGITVREKNIHPLELRQADGAFFTGTAAEVTGIESIDGFVFHRPWKNSLGEALQKLYKAKVLLQDVKELYI